MAVQLTEDQLADFIESDVIEEESRVADAEDHLIDYIKLTWPIIEPGTPLVSGWVIEAMCDHLEAVTRGEIDRLLINVPPGLMKTLLTCAFWPSWEWGPKKMPHLRYFCASYTEDLTIGANLKCRALIDSDLYKRYWRQDIRHATFDRWDLNPKQDTKTKFENTQYGYKFATSVGGAGTGERGNRVIIDDPHSVQQAESDIVRVTQNVWFRETLQTRVSNAFARFVMIMQRLHADDASAIAQEMGWYVFCAPMRYEHDHPFVWLGGAKQAEKIKEWEEATEEERNNEPRPNPQYGKGDPRTEDGTLCFPERYPEEWVARTEVAMGPYAVAGQFQQRPAPRGGGIFKVANIQMVQPWEVPTGGTLVRAWDLASSKKKNSAATASAKGKIVDGKIYVLDVTADNWSPAELEKGIQMRAMADGEDCWQDFPQDPAQAGVFQMAVFAKLLMGYKFTSSTEKQDKLDRATPFAAQVEAKNVYFVIGEWNRKTKEELEPFPAGRRKDRVDALSRMFMRLVLLQRQNRIVPPAPPKVFVGSPYR